MLIDKFDLAPEDPISNPDMWTVKYPFSRDERNRNVTAEVKPFSVPIMKPPDRV